MHPRGESTLSAPIWCATVVPDETDDHRAVAVFPPTTAPGASHASGGAHSSGVHTHDHGSASVQSSGLRAKPVVGRRANLTGKTLSGSAPMAAAPHASGAVAAPTPAPAPSLPVLSEPAVVAPSLPSSHSTGGMSGGVPYVVDDHASRPVSDATQRAVWAVCRLCVGCV